MADDNAIRIDSTKAAAAGDAADTDELHRLGYPQLLHRGLTGFRNMGIAFSIICVTGGVSIMYGPGMANGGPADMVWSWVGISLLILALAAAMGEVCSAYPTSGGLYYWSAKLAKRNNAAWAWFTGWFNVVGQIAGTAAASFGVAFFVTAFGALQWNWNPTVKLQVVVYVIATVVLALVVAFGRKIVGVLGAISVWWHTVLGLVIIVALFAKPSHHNGAGFVFFHYVNDSAFHWPFYAAMLGLLMGAETYTGYDACAHMSEETRQPGIAAPRGMVRAIVIATIVGTLMIVALSASIQNYDNELASPLNNSVAQILVDALGVAFGKVLILALAVAMVVCLNGNLTSNSRMIYAFSRDFARVDDGRNHAVSQLLSSVDVNSRTPRYAVLLAAVGTLVLGILNLWSAVAFNAAITINVIGLYTAYAIPVFLRLRQGSNFQRGPWHLGRWSTAVGWIAVAWVVVADVLFVLPQTQPVTKWANFPYTLPVFLIVVGGAALWWVLSARKWFVGPRSLGTPEELAEMERQLAVGAAAAAAPGPEAGAGAVAG